MAISHLPNRPTACFKSERNIGWRSSRVEITGPYTLASLALPSPLSARPSPRVALSLGPSIGQQSPLTARSWAVSGALLSPTSISMCMHIYMHMHMHMHMNQSCTRLRFALWVLTPLLAAMLLLLCVVGLVKRHQRERVPAVHLSPPGPSHVDMHMHMQMCICV